MNQGYKLCVPHIPNIKWWNRDNSPTVDIPIKKAGGWEAHNIYRALIILRSIWAHVINSLFWLQKCMSIRYQFNSVGVVSFSSYLYYLDTWISLSSYVLLSIKNGLYLQLRSFLTFFLPIRSWEPKLFLFLSVKPI